MKPINVGECKPWVKAGWDDKRGVFSVYCDHCGRMPNASAWYVQHHPEEPAEWVAEHNTCAAREAVSA